MRRSKRHKVIKTPEKKPEVCRICLSAKDEDRISFDLNSNWCNLMSFCCEITIQPERGPLALCVPCSTKLKDFSDFKILAQKSDKLWNNVLITKVKTEPEIIEIKDDDESDAKDEYLDTEYLDPDFIPDEEDCKTLKVEVKSTHSRESESDNGNEPFPGETETEIKSDHPSKTKKASKQAMTDKIDKQHLRGLSQKRFIKKYFEILTAKGNKIRYECMRCEKQFARCQSLPLHVQKCHDSEVLIMKKPESKRIDPEFSRLPSIYDCGLCDFQHVEEFMVLRHINEQHVQPNDLACKKCDYVGRDMADVISHRYKHLPTNYYRYYYRCPECRFNRTNNLTLQFHYRSVHLKKPGGWCSVCSKMFNAYIYFRNHVRLHKEEKFICDYCGKKYLFRNAIITHIREHMNVRNYVCDTCGKSFKRNNALVGHIRAYHTDLKPVPCDHCNKHFKNAYSLKHHLKMVKKGNNFVCDICYKGYATMSLMKKHRFWHTGERPFTCETCGGKYKSNGNLKLHMRRHMGIYPYKCDSCGKQFMTSTQLKAHSSVHTGVRRVKCLVCDRTFHEKRQMMAHCQAKHESCMLKHEDQATSIAVPQVFPGNVS